MNIIEAIKSGKRFRRKPGNMWDPNFWYEALSEADIANRLCRPMWAYEDLVADDWEVEEEKATITAAQFQKALDAASLSRQWIIPAPFVQDPAILHAYHRDVVAMFDDFVVKLKKELGL